MTKKVLLMVIISLQASMLEAASLKRIQNETENQENTIKSEDASAAHFYGQVFDSNQNPIEGAIVSLIIQKEGGKEAKESSIKTDSQGKFKSATYNLPLLIQNISKNGYAFDYRKIDVLEYSANNSQLPGGNENDPILFYLTKIDGPVVVQSMYSFAFVPSKELDYKIDLTSDGPMLTNEKKRHMMKNYRDIGEAKQQDTKQKIGTEIGSIRGGKKDEISFLDHNMVSELMNERIANRSNVDNATTEENALSDNEQTENIVLHDDIIIIGKYITERAEYEIVVRSLEGTEGIILEDQSLDKAPDAGYAQEITWSQKAQEGPKNKSLKYLYVKARDGEIYSQLTIKTKTYPSSILLTISNVTNRGGDTSFNYTEKHQDKDRIWDYEKMRKSDNDSKRMSRLAVQESQSSTN